MTFESLKEGTECDCTSDADFNTTSTFIRTIDGPSPKERDFLSNWERYKKQGRALPGGDCTHVCSFKGVSMNATSGYEEHEIIEVFKTRLVFARKSKAFIYKFSIGQQTGVVKHTPNTDHHSHHDLFKCDKFSIDGLKNISVLKVELEDDAD